MNTSNDDFRTTSNDDFLNTSNDDFRTTSNDDFRTTQMQDEFSLTPNTLTRQEILERAVVKDYKEASPPKTLGEVLREKEEKARQKAEKRLGLARDIVASEKPPPTQKPPSTPKPPSKPKEDIIPEEGL